MRKYRETVLGLRLGTDEEENTRARELVHQLDRWYDIKEQETAGIPWFEKHWNDPLPSLHPRPDIAGMGGGGYYGLESIREFVERELEELANGEISPSG